MTIPSFKEFCVQHDQMLLEAVDYMQMFTKIIDRHSDPEWAKKKAEDFIYIAQQVLKKNFRIVWFLKYVQWFIAYNSEQEQRFDGSVLVNDGKLHMKPLYDKIMRDIIKSSNDDSIEKKISDFLSVERQLLHINAPRGIVTNYQHFLDLNLPEINDYNPQGKLPNEVFEYFNRVEKEWAAEQEGKIPYLQQPIFDENQTPDKDDSAIYVIIDFGNGWYWVNLDTDYCDLESRAMGHCGNAGNRNSTLLSLRKLIKKSQSPSTWVWEPHVTFELEEDGMLGQMKGKANDKPESKYHGMIVALLLHKDTVSSRGDTDFYIKGIRGGGYKPETNFSLDDLTEEQAEEVVKQNPNLDIMALLKAEFGDKVVENKTNLGTMIRIDGFQIYSQNSRMAGLDDLYEEKRNGVSKVTVVDMCKGEHIEGMDFEYDNVHDILNYYTIDATNKATIEKFLDENYSDWREENDDWEEYVKEQEPDEIVNALQQADMYTRENSAQDDMWKDFKKAVNSSDYLIYEGGETFSFLFNKKRDQGLIRNLIDTGTPNEDYDSEVIWTWYSPHYGWSGRPTNKDFNERLEDTLYEI